jgi:hypothetical protein
MRKEKKKLIATMRNEIAKEPEDDKHRRSRHIVNWFVEKLDKSQKFKMLGCDDCNVSFDRQALVLVPKNTGALKYVAHETTAHMASVFNKCESLLFDQLVKSDKDSLTCWPFELVQFAVTSIAHAFHAKHVICGAVHDDFLNQQFMMPLDKSDFVLVIGCHANHYAMLEVDPKKEKSLFGSPPSMKAQALR